MTIMMYHDACYVCISVYVVLVGHSASITSNVTNGSENKHYTV